MGQDAGPQYSGEMQLQKITIEISQANPMKLP